MATSEGRWAGRSQLVKGFNFRGGDARGGGGLEGMRGGRGVGGGGREWVEGKDGMKGEEAVRKRFGGRFMLPSN